MKKLLFAMITVLNIAAVCAAPENKAEIVLDTCRNRGGWSFFNGGEFPGAQGGMKIDSTSNKVMVWFDFTKGGKYVAVSPRTKLPEETVSVDLVLNADRETSINYRIIDKNGRYFQGRSSVLKAGKNKISMSTSGPWSGIWGGKSKAKAPIAPKGIHILMTDAKNKTGKVIIESCVAITKKLPAQRFAGKDSSFSGSGWHFTSKWIPGAAGPILCLDAENSGGGPLNLAISFPEMARNTVQRFVIPAEPARQTFMYAPPLKDGGNINNIYKIKAVFTDKDGNSINRIFALKGSNAVAQTFGNPVNSKDIKSLPFGFCSHFSYGRSGAFAGWRNYEKLIKLASAAGFKWVRDGCRIIKDKNGNYQADPYDLGWMKYAKDNGIDTILVISMSAKEKLPEFLKRVTATVRDTKGLVNVFELGNEPNNFGDWRKSYGGTWNGKEKDNSTSKWVLAHLKYTNAAADLIKKLRSGATVIGTGACAPTNIRYLNAGLTKNVDGLVEHPYGFSLPAEKVPYGLNLAKRDGIAVGDKNNTFAGLIKSYHEHCKRTGKDRSLWLTEFGFSTYWFNGKNEKGMYLGYSEDAQATYLVRRFMEGFTLPVSVACVYDLLDDYSSTQFNAEANFGIIRHDYTPKPSYLAIQRMNSFLNGYKFNKGIQLKIESQPLHRACKRGTLIHDWDKATIASGNEVRAYGFSGEGKNPMLAVWSALPYCREFYDRVCTIRVKGMKQYTSKPVGIDIVTGVSFDIPVKVDGNDLVFENLILKDHPIMIKLFQ